ncbi:hypothetical protein [Mucilaginibacter psychrotolerans]|uniref:Tetratricopeptide repeat protein n=1 Tax=Mucilaginibacter psychrotolerans TaxID=1524096 RepID=A0A4Y8SI39_9SPHI|nr:hypothetical protein [Mucilaginibacter psychrotolerans]TFF38295.1 hypothetical protein E2R66_09685 [Mucilaginibacter psychrotolerans]
MEQNIDNRHKEILWDLLANPAENGQLYKHNLERLVQDNPQSGLLQVMYARSGQTPDIRRASAYFSPKTLYKILHDADDLLPVARERINKGLISVHTAGPENYFNSGPATELEDSFTRSINIPTNYLGELVSTPSPLDAVQNLPAFEESKAEPATESIFPFSAPSPEQSPVDINESGVPPALPAHEPEYTEVLTSSQSSAYQDDDDEYDNPWDFSKLDEVKPVAVDTPAHPEPVAEPKIEPVYFTPATPALPIEPVAPIIPPGAEQSPAVPTQPITQPVDVSSFDTYEPENVFHKQDYVADEIYNEIVSIDDIGVESLSNKFAEDELPEDTIVNAADEDVAAQQCFIDAETEKLIYGNIAATDYLSFDKKLDELRTGGTASKDETLAEPQSVVTEALVAEASLAAAQQAEPAEKEQDIVSKYNDDTLPYSFMWWLDKTRKEHAAAYQPYAPPAQGNTPNNNVSASRSATDELQQQYFANIFSLTSVSSIGDIEPPKVEFDPGKKEDVIIERFIHTDPQIKPLSPDKLDNENKARKSAEDQDAMVTETLARIYGDQMLYHKAIATYKKLMLKIPEKKLYFAAQIEQLEKKIN